MLSVQIGVIQLAILMAMMGKCLSTPIRVALDEGQTGFHQLPDGGEKGKVPFGHIGSAVAPVVGAVVGPLLVNIANGITNGITSTITSGYEPLDYGHDPTPFGHYDVYLVNFDDESRPYLLLDAIENGNRPEYYGAASPYNIHSTAHHTLSTENTSHETGKESLPEIETVD